MAPAKVAVEYVKKFNNFKIIGGAFEGKKIDEEKIKFLASLLSLDEIRCKIIGLLTIPAQKIAFVLKAPAGQLARLFDAQSKKLENSKSKNNQNTREISVKIPQNSQNYRPARY